MTDNSPIHSAPNPRQDFDSPKDVIYEVDMTASEKVALLTDWDLDLENRLKAEEEGMSASDPISSQREAKLAEESAAAKSALAEMVATISENPDSLNREKPS